METFNLDEGRLMTREEFIEHVWPQQRPDVVDLDVYIHYPIFFIPKVLQ